MVPAIMEGPESWLDNGTEIKQSNEHDKNEYPTQKHTHIFDKLFFKAISHLHQNETKLKRKRKKLNALKPMNAFTYTLKPKPKAEMKTCTNWILFFWFWRLNFAVMPVVFFIQHHKA